MTEPLTAADAAAIVTAVEQFSDRAAKLETLPANVAALAASNLRLTKRGRWNRIWIVVTAVGLVLDLVISLVFWRQHIQQNCLSDLRVAGSHIADSDRKNVDMFFAAVINIKTPAEFAVAYGNYQHVRDANDAARHALGQANTQTCPLF